MEKQEFTSYLKANEKRIIIFGCGDLGIRIAKTLKMNNISPSCFCDNNLENVGMNIENIDVVYLSAIQKNYDHPIVIISPRIKELQEEITIQLKNIFRTKKIEICTLKDFFLNIEKIYLENIVEKAKFIDFQIQNYGPSKTPYLHANAIDLFVTERCSLKCKDCANLMQYFQHPKDLSTANIYRDIDYMEEFFDHIMYLNVVGGEPFMHKDAYDIIGYAQTKKNIDIVNVLTNGTIPPNELKLIDLSRDNLYFRITQYAGLSSQVDAWVEMLEKHGFTYEVKSLDTWYDCAEIKKHNRTPEELHAIHETCSFESSVRPLNDGKLFRCPFANGLYRLKGIPVEDIEYVDLMDTSKSREEIRAQLKQFIYGMPYIKACDFCNGRNEFVTLPPAQQIKQVRLYEKYE